MADAIPLRLGPPTPAEVEARITRLHAAIDRASAGRGWGVGEAMVDPPAPPQHPLTPLEDAIAHAQAAARRAEGYGWPKEAAEYRRIAAKLAGLSIKQEI